MLSKLQVTGEFATKKDLFEAGSKENELSTRRELICSSEVYFYNLPRNLPIPFSTEMQKEMDKKIEQYKSLRPSFDVSTNKARFNMQDKLSELDLNQNLPYWGNAEEIMKDDNKVQELAREDVIKYATESLKQPLEVEFIEQVVIPQHWKRIVGEVFDPQKIIIQKNLPLPQPHQHPILSDSYAISAIK